MGRAPVQGVSGGKAPEAENLLKYWEWENGKNGKMTPFSLFQCFTNCLVSVDTWIL